MRLVRRDFHIPIMGSVALPRMTEADKPLSIDSVVRLFAVLCEGNCGFICSGRKRPDFNLIQTLNNDL